MAKSKEDRKKTSAPAADTKGKKSKKDSGSEGFTEEKVPVRLVQIYKEKIVPELNKKFGYKSIMQTPKLEKICINVGVGIGTTDAKIIENTVKEIEAITGQKAVVVKAKKSVSNFKLREGMNVAVRLTLRNARMYEFFDKLVNITIPRIRDFRGLSDKSFDGRGNYSLGIKEQIIFPEINVDSISRISGMDITIVTSAKTDEEAFELLKQFGFPFITKQSNN
ncbi:MAG TPA: 50S ribosomal protein L5 [Ignavibacteria bacterium]|nr:50S ribosomal protein L5 [Ignavibacteria bacterium]